MTAVKLPHSTRTAGPPREEKALLAGPLRLFLIVTGIVAVRLGTPGRISSPPSRHTVCQPRRGLLRAIFRLVPRLASGQPASRIDPDLLRAGSEPDPAYPETGRSPDCSFLRNLGPNDRTPPGASHVGSVLIALLLIFFLLRIPTGECSEQQVSRSGREENLRSESDPKPRGGRIA